MHSNQSLEYRFSTTSADKAAIFCVTSKWKKAHNQVLAMEVLGLLQTSHNGEGFWLQNNPKSVASSIAIMEEASNLRLFTTSLSILLCFCFRRLLSLPLQLHQL